MNPQAHGHPRQRLFAYGTLRRKSGHPMSRVLAHNARLLGPGAIRGRKCFLGPYPAIMADDEAGWVSGNVFEILAGRHVWRVLDIYEGCHEANPCYERRCTAVWLTLGGRGVWIEAWSYLMRPDAPSSR
jgi:gamma-glutamylcyclotransferase (GGCT)/AIG2-like uncharacterized protein YtfP